MKLIRISSPLSLVLLFFFLFLGTNRVFSESYSKIRFLNPQVDFGDLNQGEKVSYRFYFKNEGEGVLKVNGIHSSCGCIVIGNDSGKEYGSHELSYFDVQLDTSRFQGRLDKSITVYSNNPSAPNHVLKIKAQVIAPYVVDRPVLQFDKIGLGEERTESIKVHNIKDPSTKLLDVIFNDQLFAVDWTQDAKQWKINVRFKKQSKVLDLKETIQLKTSHKHLPLFPIEVRGHVEGAIEKKPQYVEFGAIAKDKVQKRNIVLSSNQKFDLDIESAEIYLNGDELDRPSDYITWEMKKLSDGKVSVDFFLSHKFEENGSVHGKVLIKTNDNYQKNLTVDFYGVFL